jgi:hypothetical protein
MVDSLDARDANGKDMPMRHRKIARAAAATAAAALVGVVFVACGGESQAAEDPSGATTIAADAEAAAVDDATAEARRRGGGNRPGSGAVATNGTEPTTEEAEGLLLMREEEKLARDVYLALFEQWEMRVFERIAGSEQRHTDAVAGLLDRFGLEDPFIDEPGVFVDPGLQALYDDLVEQGSESRVAALEVGAMIEELDIADLRDLLAETDRRAIERVYRRLVAGSENHLRAFARSLEAAGGEYVPTYLDEDEVADILAAKPNRRGGAGGTKA